MKFKYDYGDEVRVVNDAPKALRPGEAGAVCGMRQVEGIRFYTVEYPDGKDAEISEEFLQPAE